MTVSINDTQNTKTLPLGLRVIVLNIKLSLGDPPKERQYTVVGWLARVSQTVG